MSVLLWCNAVLGLASTGFGIAALARPLALLPNATAISPSGAFYAQMYAARVVPLGLAVAAFSVVGAVDELRPRLLAPWLLVAAAAQAGDLLAATRWRLRGMAGGASALFAVHLLTALLVLR